MILQHIKRIQAMCNDEHGRIGTQGLNRFHYSPFGLIIQRAGGLIENEDIGTLVQGSGNANALPLAAPLKTHSALPTRVSNCSGHDWMVSSSWARKAASRHVPCLSHRQGRQRYIAGDGTVCQENALGHMGDMGLPAIPVIRSNDHPIHCQRT